MNGVGLAAILIAVAAVGGIIAWAANHQWFSIHNNTDLHEIGRAVASARAESDRLPAKQRPGAPADAAAPSSSTTGQPSSVRRIARRSDTSS